MRSFWSFRFKRRKQNNNLVTGYQKHKLYKFFTERGGYAEVFGIEYWSIWPFSHAKSSSRGNITVFHP